ncbi:M13 family metallopeptidase [Mangrovibacterium diazotrophicum]|nr:M13 family metallopeptidase [Mangrovibacterium diazotrophicum]
MNYIKSLGFGLLAAALFSCGQGPDKEVSKAIDPANMDTTVSPGQDFDQYANGGWKKLNPLPDEKSRYGAFDVLGDESEKQIKELFAGIAAGTFADGTIEKKIADYYAAGMDTASIEAAGLSPLKPFIDQIDALHSKEDMQKLLAEWQSWGLNPLFGIYADADQKNSAMKVAYLYQAGLGMPNRDYYLNDDEHTLEIQQKYRAYIAGLLEQLGQDSVSAKKDAETIYTMENEMAEFSMSMLDQRDPYKVYNKMDLAQLSNLAPQYDWTAYFKTIGANDPGDFIVAQPEFMKNMAAMLTEKPLADWKQYLKYHTISDFAGVLPKTISDMSFEFYGKTLSGTPAQRPRWKRVQGSTNNALGEAVGELYVKEYFPPQAKERMLKLVKNLRKALASRIENLSWMSDTTKEKAVEKLDAITVKIGYPDKWKDYTALEITPDSYFQNVLSSSKFYFEDMISKINKPVDKTEWGMTPQTVNAYYNPSANEIVFPAAILQPPFFFMEADDAVNYGAIGVVIGHEMSHGFDDQGRQYDKVGNLNDWWQADDAERFTVKADLLANEYSQFTVLDTVKADGKLTLGENIADLGGLNISYTALHMALDGKEQAEIDGFTPDQRFFLAYAHLWAQNIRDEEKLRLTKVDVHSLGRYRVLGPLRNMPEFYAAFDVKPGDYMYLPEDERVVIW